MRNKLPFEDVFKNKMNDLPTGNEDAGWQKMKELLEEKDKRKPFVWLNLYTICGCILIIAAGIWLISSHTLTNNQKNVSVKKAGENQNEQKPQEKAGETFTSDQPAGDENGKTKSKGVGPNTSTGDKQSSERPVYNNNSKAAGKNKLTAISQRYPDKKASGNNIDVSAGKGTDSSSGRNHDDITPSALINSNSSFQHRNDSARDVTGVTSRFPENDSAAATMNTLSNLQPSSNADSTFSKNQTKSLLKPKTKSFIEAGIQVKQQIPLAGQKIIPYNYNGEKKLISDYIPAVFVKFQKGDHWFLKGEFSYGTSYYIKQFAYSQKTTADYQASMVSIVRSNLQKVYYTQLPVSFNYYIKPTWSLGAGLSYGWFRGAIAEQETTVRDFVAGTQKISNQNIYFKSFTDSFLYKSTSSFFFQTGYASKRWSFTLQYSQNLQPFVKYTLPDGTIDSKRNASLNVLIGYSFFQNGLSKK